jgi:hypothetical protein
MTGDQLSAACYDNALECARMLWEDDPGLRMTDYAHFELVMWPDDHDLEEYRVSREDYEDILKRIYAVLLGGEGF